MSGGIIQGASGYYFVFVLLHRAQERTIHTTNKTLALNVKWLSCGVACKAAAAILSSHLGNCSCPDCSISKLVLC